MEIETMVTPTDGRARKLGISAGTPWIYRARRQERCDIYLAYAGVQKLSLAGFVLTEKGDPDAVIAYCPLGCDEGATDKQLLAELFRQLRIAVRIAEDPESAREATDAVWLGWIGAEDRAAPPWLYGLRCAPLTREWDGHYVRLRPFCPHLFEAMARQTRAAAWIERRQRK